jgi:hypothetical protein
MKHIPLFCILFSLCLVSCVLFQAPAVTVPPPSPWAPTATVDATATPSPAAPTATAAPPTATPEPPTPTSEPAQEEATATPSPATAAPGATPASAPTAAPTQPAGAEAWDSPGETYALQEERLIGDYAVRLWQDMSHEDDVSLGHVATVSQRGERKVEVEFVFGLGEETGSDITGEGHPDVILEVFTGGAHCCFSTIVYDLGPTMTKVLETPLSNCGGTFEDLDGDGIPEYITCDDRFAYTYCPYASSPVVQAVLQYDPGRSGYVPASPLFANTYEGPIAMHTELAENAQPGELGEWDGTSKCAVLPLVLDYLYTGQDEQAWVTFQDYYTPTDALLFWAEVTRAIDDSPLYAPSGTMPDVPWPDYYMLQLEPGCGPEDMQQAIWVLDREQFACEQDAPRRDIYWLQEQLQRIDLVHEGEMLLLAPEGCTDDCRLDVVRVEDSAEAGVIRLDTAGGFPGQVYRQDDQESDRWRLRGDLTWERVPSP